jgi:NAD(P)-dependent dehydrogenase (short-subunit alcohol dehydrogenase family)
MENKFPNVVVVYGSESRILRETIDWLIEQKCQIIRIFNKSVPIEHGLCIDISSINDLDTALEVALSRSVEDIQIGFVGAAFARQNSLMVQMSDSDVENAIDINIKSYVYLSRKLLRHMTRHKYGRFVFLSSFRAEHTNSGAIIYGASKAFCEQYFSGIGREMGRFNITSTSIRMGYFDSGMMDEYPELQQKNANKAASIGRLGNGADIRAAIEFAFVNDYTNSGIIELNGGLIRE